jgi:hypothetical protein
MVTPTRGGAAHIAYEHTTNHGGFGIPTKPHPSNVPAATAATHDRSSAIATRRGSLLRRFAVTQRCTSSTASAPCS